MKFTILTACHNDEKYILECSKSILSQCHSDFEWIVVDDCSEDKTYNILESINDSRLKLFRNKEQLFCSSTYAKAVSLATGEVCGVVDGDDVLGKDAIRTIVSKYKEHPDIGYIYTQHYWCDSNLRVKKKGLSSFPAGNQSFARLASRRKHCFSHWRTFRRELAKKAVLFPEGLKYTVDKNMGFVLQTISKGGFFDKPLYYYRYYKGNMSLVHAGDQKRLWRQLASEYIYKKHYPVVKVT